METRYGHLIDAYDLGQLSAEVAALGLPGYLGLLGGEGMVEAIFADALQPSQVTTLEAAIDAHTADPSADLKALHKAAVAALETATGEMQTLVRAVVLESLAYANAGRAKLNALLTWLGAQTTLAQRAQLNGFSLPEATPIQARNSIRDRVNAGEGDVL